MSCLICYSDNNIISIPCSCQYCSNCLKDWTIEQIGDIKFQSTRYFLCPNFECKKEYNIENLNNSLSKENLDIINDSLLTSYMQNTKDITSCPNSNCSYSGIIDLDTKCKKNLICEICKTEWRDSASYSLSEQIFQFCNSYREKLSEFPSILYQEAFTNLCPKCSIRISKNGGCKHMSCKKCAHEFCWYCMQNYHGHKNYLCAINIIVKLAILGFFLFNFLLLINLFWTITNWMTAVVWFLIQSAIYDLFIVILAMACGIVRENYHYMHVYPSKSYGYRKKVIALIFGIALAISFYIYFLYWLEVLSNAIHIYLIELACAGCVKCYFEKLDNWIKKTF